MSRSSFAFTLLQTLVDIIQQYATPSHQNLEESDAADDTAPDATDTLTELHTLAESLLPQLLHSYGATMSPCDQAALRLLRSLDSLLSNFLPPDSPQNDAHQIDSHQGVGTGAGALSTGRGVLEGLGCPWGKLWEVVQRLQGQEGVAGEEGGPKAVGELVARVDVVDPRYGTMYTHMFLLHNVRTIKTSTPMWILSF